MAKNWPSPAGLSARPEPASVAVIGRVERAGPREVAGQAGAGKRFGDRVGGEARLALLAVGDDRLAGGLQAPDRVLGGGGLLGLQPLPVDLAVVVVLIGVLQPLGTRQRPHELGRDG